MRPDRERRMHAILDLERRISTLELPQLGYSTVSEHAETHVLDSTTLAVVMRCTHNTAIVEHAIRAQNDHTIDISTDRDILTVTLRPRHRAAGTAERPMP
ncbi:hypothetical protein B0T44_05880 [Nocardia donostiensis]|uniref:Uncharacterized protein n=2 Tax=Nocardia donostiensis TaxID=1538463 RepID=A0A1V2TKJ7_9NOCA|nr:hypothetical protein B0T46_05660 [Nocardia donostiensis]OQS13434.1 hypothetical protein B0T36_20315 [Nocardia donostiensis]OQS22179.1 hypothetical protein B0T44_05880 [Nocardia donostiensis]